MAEAQDSLPLQEGPDRVHYATGVLLGAEDFQAEQAYHRSRLARALAYAMGYGTLAGLAVSHEPAQPADADNPARSERLLVAPGLAIDRLYGLRPVMAYGAAGMAPPGCEPRECVVAHLSAASSPCGDEPDRAFDSAFALGLSLDIETLVVRTAVDHRRCLF